MSRRMTILTLLVLTIICLTGFKGCGNQPNAQLPDLVPVSSGPGNQCAFSGSNLAVSAKNIGAGDVGATTTTIEFLGVPGPPSVTTRPTPPIAKGATVPLLPIPIPNNCGGPNCGALISVDKGNTIQESDYNNNSTTCILRIG